MIPDHLTGAELVNLGLLLMLAGIAGLALVVYAGEAAFRAAVRAWARRQARRVLDLPATPWPWAAVAFGALLALSLVSLHRCGVGL